MSKTSQARAHHFAPQCWLAGFTDTGEKTGTLWVTDLKRRKQWHTSPPNAAHCRDLYRLSKDTDPVKCEKLFANIESATAPLLKNLYVRHSAPTREEFEQLLLFIAMEYIRVPAFRPTLIQVATRIHSAWFAKALRTPQTWQRSLEKAHIAPDTPGADYEQMRRFHRERQRTLVAKNDWFL